MHAWPQPVKLYYSGPMFRRERPQKGDTGSFIRLGGSAGDGAANQDREKHCEDAAVDAEVIEMVMAFSRGSALRA